MPLTPMHPVDEDRIQNRSQQPSLDGGESHSLVVDPQQQNGVRVEVRVAEVAFEVRFVGWVVQTVDHFVQDLFT